MVAMVNTQDVRRTMAVAFDEVLDLDGKKPHTVVNAWTGRNMGCKRGNVKTTLDPHDTVVLLFKNSRVGVADVQQGNETANAADGA